jgi:hypothetical protein
MTLDELNIIHRALNRISTSADEHFINLNKARDIVKREIHLKTMDPRSNNKINECSCIWDHDHRAIKESNPACPQHGVAQQLNRSQME